MSMTLRGPTREQMEKVWSPCNFCAGAKYIAGEVAAVYPVSETRQEETLAEGDFDFCPDMWPSAYGRGRADGDRKDEKQWLIITYQDMQPPMIIEKPLSIMRNTETRIELLI